MTQAKVLAIMLGALVLLNLILFTFKSHAAPTIRSVINHQFGAHAKMARCVSWYESHWKVHAKSPTGDYGLFQINYAAHHSQFDWGRIYDPAYNAHAAWVISSHGTDWSPWAAYKAGLCG